MSLTKNPYGLSFYDYKGGKNRMAVSTYYIASGTTSSFGQGDPLNMGANGYLVAYTVPTEPSSPFFPAATSTTIGVAVAFSWTSTTGVVMNNQPYLPSGTSTLNGYPIIVTVADLFSNVYQIQANNQLPTTYPNTCIGRNYNIVLNTPSAATGQSTAALDTTTYVATTNYWLTLKVVGLAPATQSGSTNSWSDPYPDLLVLINNHTFKTGTNGI